MNEPSGQSTISKPAGTPHREPGIAADTGRTADQADAATNRAEPASIPTSSPPSTSASTPGPKPGSRAPAPSDRPPSFRMREPVDAVQKEQMVERITASLAEMLARAMRQSVEQAVDDALASAPVQGPAESARRAVHAAEMQKPTPSAPRT